ncbi:MFS transporter [Siculibacillus lacustris]|uniref:MFS transporter n=1 Tax=Siculibacillus lacustris TaxID=1549641 RepID=A0A4Q9VI33_9HYPH|nr:MFS transporter [Siculibacillus lacustris]TBW34302.1 MFS transporter [Siculibacillus lacustris]
MTAAPPLQSRTRLLALAAVIAAAAAVATGLSLGLPLLAMVMQARGHSASWIGLNTAVGGLAALAATPLVTPLARRIGPSRLLIASLGAAVATFAAFPLVESTAGWFALRVVFHAGLTGTFVMSEFWIVSLAPPDRRGLSIGLYGTAFSLGLSIGPTVLGLVGSTGPAPFAIGTALLGIALVPLIAARHVEPVLEHASALSVMDHVRAAPEAMAGAFVFGAVEAGGLSILPLWGLGVGLGEARSALLLTAIGLGTVALQIPLGLLADRVDRIRLLAAASVVGAIGAAALPFVVGDFAVTMALLFVWGGFGTGLYTVGLAVLGARRAGADLAGANAAFVLMYGLGMVVGPLAIGRGLDLAPYFGLPVAIAGFFVAHLAVLAVARRRQT